MKKYFLLSIILALPTKIAFAADLPFIATKHFSFGGVPAFNQTYSVVIKKDHSMVLKSQTCYSQGCDKEITLYKGKFKPLIFVKEDDGYEYYLWFKKKSVHLLDQNKKQAYDCDTVNENYGPCISTYY